MHVKEGIIEMSLNLLSRCNFHVICKKYLTPGLPFRCSSFWLPKNKLIIYTIVNSGHCTSIIVHCISSISWLYSYINIRKYYYSMEVDYKPCIDSCDTHDCELTESSSMSSTSSSSSSSSSGSLPIPP